MTGVTPASGHPILEKLTVELDNGTIANSNVLLKAIKPYP